MDYNMNHANGILRDLDVSEIEMHVFELKIIGSYEMLKMWLL